MFNWLYAKRHAGRFLIRVEDTDRERSTDEAVKAIFDGLSWLELFADEEPVFQFSRADRHREVVDQLLESGRAYRDFTSPEETTRLRDEAKAEKRAFESPWRDREPTVDDLLLPHVVRFRRPQGVTVTVQDEVQGAVSWSTDDLDDLLTRAQAGPVSKLSDRIAARTRVAAAAHRPPSSDDATPREPGKPAAFNGADWKCSGAPSSSSAL